MPIDPSIPLSSTQLNPLQTAQLAGQRLQLQQARQGIADQNALRALFAQPGAVDAQGMPTQNTLARLTQLNPEEGMKLRGQMLDLQLGKAGLSEKQWKAGVDAAAGAKQLYDQQIDQGVSPAQAQRNAQVLYSQNMKQLAQSGLLSPDQIAMLNPTFDPQRVASNMEWLKLLEQRRENQQRIGMEGARLGMEQKFHADELGLQRDRLKWEIESGRGDKQQVLMDPAHKDAAGNPTPYIYDMTKHKAFTLDGQPYTPGGAVKMSNGAQAGVLTPQQQASVDDTAKMIAHYQMPPLSGYALRSPWGQQVMAKVSQLNHDYQAEQYGARAKAVKDFSTGKQGDQLRSFNVAISHLKTLREAADALKNGDIKLFNSLSQRIANETGSAAPANFDAIRSITNDEVLKAVIGSAGALGDRTKAEEYLSKSSSPEQLSGVADKYIELIAGQVRGLKKQYEDTTGLKNFDTRLLPETRSALDAVTKKHEGGGTNATEAAAPGASHPPVPKVLQGRQLQWNPQRQLFRDKETGAIYDSSGTQVN